MLAKIDPDFASRQPVLTFDHHEIDGLVEEINAAFYHLNSKQPVEESAEAYRQLVRLLKLIRKKLADHLEREEATFIPAVARNFTLQQQSAIEQGMYKSMPNNYLAVMLPWTFQYLDTEERRSALSELSGRFRYLYNVSWQKRYDRLAFSFSL
jgi:hypothetical protein